MGSISSDSSGEADEQYTTTNVTLGYASKEPTDDTFSHLGGSPTWLGDEPPSASLAKCKTCNNMMALLLQLNGDLPEYFPGHERKLYIFACRNKPCPRKPGTIRALRATKISTPKKSSQPGLSANPIEAPKATPPPTNLGDSIFNSTSPNQASTAANPFSTSSHASLNPNPFSTTSAANPIPYGHQKHNFKSLPSQPNPQASPTSTSSLSQTFAQKAQISSPSVPSTPAPRTPWPSPNSLPHPYPSYHLDADYEALSALTPASTISSTVPITDTDPTSTEPNNDDPSSWLSPSAKADKTFLRFAARLAENPEQVLRYEFRGEPLLYHRFDEVGRAFPSAALAMKVSVGTSPPNRVPACGNCGGKRVFEMQLTPHAISELEAEEEGVEGMEWGTVVVGVCDGDCVEKGVEEGKVGWVEEWVGVSWEESVGGRKG